MNGKHAKADMKAYPAGPLTGKYLKAKGMAALVLYLGSSPLFLLPGAYLLPGNMAAALLLPLAALAFTFGVGLLKGKRRRMGFLLALILQAALCAWVLIPRSPMASLLFLPCLLIMLLFMPRLFKPAGLEWPASLLTLGIAIHLAGQAVKGQAVFTDAGGALSLFFSGYLLLLPFVFNRYALIDATGAEHSPPAKLLSRNRRLLAMIGLIALLAANFKGFESAVLAAWALLKRAFATLLIWLSTLLPDMTSSKEQGTPQGLDLSELGGGSPPGAFSVILEAVLKVLAVVVAAAMLLFALYHLFRLLKRALKKILARLREYSRAIGEGYVDKTENLFDWGEVVRDAKDRWVSFQKRHQRPPAWESLSPGETVRRVYALLVKRMRRAEPSLTAREALQGGLSLPPDQAGQMASLYEKARYSDHPVSPGEAEAMRKSAGV